MAEKEQSRLPYDAVKNVMAGLKQASEQKVEQSARSRSTAGGGREERSWWTK